MDDFFTSEPAFTPLMAGTFTLTAAATLATTFGWPGSLTAVIISMLLAVAISINKKISIIKKVVFYLINAMTIFIVAMGLNSAGMSLTQEQKNNTVERSVEDTAQKPFFHSWF